ncbi:hypothetical protein FQN60_009805 [Etheostoma spectabile]|uniref:Centromere protein P n=1 Tax=Etheostoma spectabile TaxID=54343 RepID=A0A5J5DKK2_9PERO|nr:hypothetical protein FQN60_009805 [Etheostoma spectabile]
MVKLSTPALLIESSSFCLSSLAAVCGRRCSAAVCRSSAKRVLDSSPSSSLLVRSSTSSTSPNFPNRSFRSFWVTVWLNPPTYSRLIAPYPRQHRHCTDNKHQRMMEKMSEENIEDVRVLEAQIEHLQAEVAALQCQQQDNHKDITFHLRGHMQDAMSYVCGQRQAGEKEKVLSMLTDEVEELEEDLKRQTQINGISLNSCTTKTLQSSGRQLVQQLCISGHCSELVFQVEFKLSEVKSSGNFTRLPSSPGPPWKTLESLVEESRDLLLFFRTLRTYSDRCDDRRRTFQHFQRYRPIGSTFIQVKLSGYLDSNTGLPSIRTSLRLSRRDLGISCESWSNLLAEAPTSHGTSIQLDAPPSGHTAKGGRLDVPVFNRIGKQTDACVQVLLDIGPDGTEIVDSHSADSVAMESVSNKDQISSLIGKRRQTSNRELWQEDKSASYLMLEVLRNQAAQQTSVHHDLTSQST